MIHIRSQFKGRQSHNYNYKNAKISNFTTNFTCDTFDGRTEWNQPRPPVSFYKTNLSLPSYVATSWLSRANSNFVTNRIYLSPCRDIWTIHMYVKNSQYILRLTYRNLLKDICLILWKVRIGWSNFCECWMTPLVTHLNRLPLDIPSHYLDTVSQVR